MRHLNKTYCYAIISTSFLTANSYTEKNMKKRIVICADGTWNRPEQNLKKDFPTNVLKLARAIKQPVAKGTPQQVFYDWGVGSYDDKIIGGVTGKGLHKNILDCYRYIVHNYSPGDELYLFGFSRGAYTIRALCGLINNCGIVKKSYARFIQKAFDHYKNRDKGYEPNGKQSVLFRDKYSYKSENEDTRNIKFIGVWDTVGALGVPFSFLGWFEDEDEFYDMKIGGNIEIARHALAIDECRKDFEPTIWQARKGVDIKQVWFAGCHADIGGGYAPDPGGTVLSNNSLYWIVNEARAVGLQITGYGNQPSVKNMTATMHDSKRHVYRIRGEYIRPVLQNGTKFHSSVQTRWQKDPKYRPPKLKEYLKDNGGWSGIQHLIQP